LPTSRKTLSTPGQLFSCSGLRRLDLGDAHVLLGDDLVSGQGGAISAIAREGRACERSARDQGGGRKQNDLLHGNSFR
jgi:hypothetical protein